MKLPSGLGDTKPPDHTRYKENTRQALASSYAALANTTASAHTRYKENTITNGYEPLIVL